MSFTLTFKVFPVSCFYLCRPNKMQVRWKLQGDIEIKLIYFSQSPTPLIFRPERWCIWICTFSSHMCYIQCWVSIPRWCQGPLVIPVCSGQQGHMTQDSWFSTACAEKHMRVSTLQKTTSCLYQERLQHSKQTELEQKSNVLWDMSRTLNIGYNNEQ